eukprot:4830869-Pyramimonas_sp.AAC.1
MKLYYGTGAVDPTRVASRPPSPALCPHWTLASPHLHRRQVHASGRTKRSASPWRTLATLPPRGPMRC